MTETLHHYTLTTGDVTWTERAEVQAAAIALLRPFIAGMMSASSMTPRTEPIPTRPAYFLQGLTMHGRDAPLFRVYARPDPPEGGEALTLVSFGVALNGGAGAAALWRSLHGLADGLPAVTDAETPPDALPWCAVAVHSGLLSRPAAMTWLGDFERCVAWTVRELAREGDSP